MNHYKNNIYSRGFNIFRLGLDNDLRQSGNIASH